MANPPVIEKPQVVQEAKPEVSPEVGETAEKQVEIPKHAEKTSEAKAEVLSSIAKASVSAKSKARKAVVQKTETQIKIEKIMSENLEQFYNDLPDNLKITFKNKGEETAKRIEEMIGKVKINIRKIVKLIYEWLKIIPGVNKFYIEQEAKLKTDKILKEAKDQKEYWSDK